MHHIRRNCQSVPRPRKGSGLWIHARHWRQQLQWSMPAPDPLLRSHTPTRTSNARSPASTASLLERMLSDPGVSVKPAVNQCGHSVGAHNSTHNPKYGGSDVTAKFCADHDISYSAYSPLGGLSGLDIYNNPRVVAIAKAHDKSPAQVALRWCASRTRVGDMCRSVYTHAQRTHPTAHPLTHSLTHSQAGAAEYHHRHGRRQGELRGGSALPTPNHTTHDATRQPQAEDMDLFSFALTDAEMAELSAL